MKNKIKYVILLATLLSGYNQLNAQVYPNDCYNGSLNDFKVSWIANSGGVPRTHVPHSMDALFVRGDGMVATICDWDEGGTNVGVWKNGAIVSIPQESGTGSWGRMSGKAVAMDDQYVYQLMHFNGNSGNDNLNGNGLRAYPPKGSGIDWQLITRYDVNTGLAARFPTGYGPLNNMLLVATQEKRLLKGLAITDDKLIVAVPGMPELEIPDMLRVYDKATMNDVPLREFRITEGGVGYLAADKRGFVWMLQGNQATGFKIVAINLANGGIRPQSTITLPAGVDAKSFAIDTRESGQERLLVANSGRDLNILIYTDLYNTPTLSNTFGVTGGVLVKSPKAGGGEYLQGEDGLMRFSGPTGVGVDDAGNIYVSNMWVKTPTAALYSYKEDTRELNWKQEGLAFTSTADFDETQTNIAYCIDKVFELDYTKEGGRMDRLVATTEDPFQFPQDFRLEPNPGSPIKTGVFKRKINNKDYLFVNNMYGTILGGFRFDKENYGYIGVPCMEVRVDGIYFWVDTNGDGQKTDDEITRSPASGNTFSVYPDHNGNIWMADNANTVVAGPAFRLWKVTGTTADGVLQYGTPATYKLPSYITLANRVLYDVERDEMLVACYTTANPTPNTAIWGQVGTTILTYKNMTQRLANIETAPSANWVHDQELVIPASPKTAQGTVTAPGVEISCKAMTYAGDYIFCFLTADGKINVYDRGPKNAYVGQLEPGDVIQRRNGWTDFVYAVNARKNANGTYEVFAEENAFAKIVHYTINSFSSDVVMTGDLAPERIWVQNGSKANIDPVNIPEGQPVKFTVRVKNIESGTVVNNRRSDPGRCLVQYKVTNLANGQVVYTGESNVHEEDIYGGEYVDMTIENSTSKPFWIYTKGNYKVDVDVNYGRKGKECVEENNYMSLTFGGGNNTGAITGPLEPPATAIVSVEKQHATSLQVYPNPTSTFLNIDVATEEGFFTAVLTSLDGREVIRKQIANHSSLNVSDLPKGTYLLQVITLKESLTQKVMINE